MRKQFNIQNDKWSLLLDLYFKGETTLEQERQLCGYFRSSKIAPEHKKYLSLFSYINEESELASYSNANQIKRRQLKNYWIAALSVAAAAVLLVGGILLRFEFNAQDGNYDESRLYKLVIGGVEVNDKQLAMNIAQNKLDIINNAMGKISYQAEKITRATNVTRKIKVLQLISHDDIYFEDTN